MATGRDEPQAGQQGGRAPQRGEQRGQWLGPAHWPAAVEASFGTVLRAVGQLLVAISGDGRPSSEARPAAAPLRPAEAPATAAAPPTDEPREVPLPAADEPTWAAPDDDDVAVMLADARARAQHIIDESVAQAQLLLRQREEAADPAAAHGQTLERLHRAVTDVVAEVRALHGRLDSIESLLRLRLPSQPSPRSADEPAPPQRAAQPAQTAAQPAVQPGQPPAPPAVQPVPPQPAVQPAQPAVQPVPPQPAQPAAQPAVQPAQPAAQPAVQPAPPPPAVTASEVTPNGSATPGHPTFAPDGGSVLLRIAPVSGFQGLMRVQDALVHVRGIREAGVEAYSQGEARLRLQLAEHLDPVQLTATLGERLGRPVRVASASLADRSLEVALG